MNFSIIIVNYNTKEILGDALASIFSNFNVKEFEIIVVDNGSTDGSIEFLEKTFEDKIILIKNKFNAGFGAANNLGAAHASGKYLFFINSDIIINRDILGEMDKMFIAEKKLGILAPALILEDNSKQKYAYGQFPTLMRVILRKAGNPPCAISDCFSVDWVSGAALAIRKEIFKKINGFDENFFMYFEDIDLCKRVKELAYEIRILPAVSLMHLGGRSIKVDGVRKNIYYTSQDYFYKKHYGIVAFILLKIFRFPFKFLNSIL